MLLTGFICISRRGYPLEVATPMLDESMRLIAKHGRMRYAGILAERQRSYKETFMTEEKEARAREFAKELLANI